MAYSMALRSCSACDSGCPAHRCDSLSRLELGPSPFSLAQALGTPALRSCVRLQAGHWGACISPCQGPLAGGGLSGGSWKPEMDLKEGHKSGDTALGQRGQLEQRLRCEYAVLVEEGHSGECEGTTPRRPQKPQWPWLHRGCGRERAELQQHWGGQGERDPLLH